MNRPLPRNERRADEVAATQADVLTLANCHKDRPWLAAMASIKNLPSWDVTGGRTCIEARRQAAIIGCHEGCHGKAGQGLTMVEPDVHQRRARAPPPIRRAQGRDDGAVDAGRYLLSDVR